MLARIVVGALWSFLAANAHATCWELAGERYRIDPLLLYSIAKVESNLQLSARHVNRDGSYDIGLMQINSRQLKRLAAYGITESRLQTEPCTAVMTGAWILGGFVQRMGYGWQAVGAYNAGGAAAREALRVSYAMKVWRYYQALSTLRQQKQHTDALVARSYAVDQ
ncbi:invasion protein IagB [Burkholderia ubonensis]|uniref:Invasion protein IagB n=1 Tax=Burkholderia ubonensis TaxID=101571 RepID=A0AB73G027_9BURK|nr:invasion protein IagB [Burkholderia ubonensis]KVL61889.1 invasion protein IagB [Burkholderia ubonensis]KVM28668.1 invasion protein IagB [Burkholderia ubonensis]KVM35179.1 invasion protein IagB [Burkholderia ubonensis]